MQYQLVEGGSLPVEGGRHLAGGVPAVAAWKAPRTPRTRRTVLPIATGISLLALLAALAALSSLAPLASHALYSAPVHARMHAHGRVVGGVVVVVALPPPANRVVDIGLRYRSREGPDVGQRDPALAGHPLHQRLQGGPPHLELGVGLHLLLHV